MKRIRISALVRDNVVKANWKEYVDYWGGEIESYEEKPISKEKGLLQEYSFDSLLDSALEFANGVWMAVKGFSKMAMFAIITIVEGLKWMWKKGVGEEKKGVGPK